MKGHGNGSVIHGSHIHLDMAHELFLKTLFVSLAHSKTSKDFKSDWL